jgi:hypothetical protein
MQRESLCPGGRRFFGKLLIILISSFQGRNGVILKRFHAVVFMDEKEAPHLRDRQ